MNDLRVPIQRQVQGKPFIEFEIPGEPQVKQRPRVTRTGHAYTPKGTVDGERTVQQVWDVLGREPFEKPVIVECEFYLGTKRRKDVDNLAKLVTDALNKRAYTDDYLIVSLWAVKLFTTPDRARTVVRIQEAAE
jgi:crossover junction endodeoxyribonuclease RusA